MNKPNHIFSPYQLCARSYRWHLHFQTRFTSDHCQTHICLSVCWSVSGSFSWHGKIKHYRENNSSLSGSQPNATLTDPNLRTMIPPPPLYTFWSFIFQIFFGFSTFSHLNISGFHALCHVCFHACDAIRAQSYVPSYIWLWQNCHSQDNEQLAHLTEFEDDPSIQ